MSDARILRNRQDDAVSAVNRMSPLTDSGSESVLVETKRVDVYPTAPRSFFACTPLRIDGPEIEGASVSFSPDTARTIFAFNLGSKLPPEETRIIAHSCGGRWTFRFDG